MRLLRLDFRDELSSIDLHPLINVVSGLEAGLQRELVKAVRALAAGSTVGLRGLVQHQGLLFELNADPAASLPGNNTTADVLLYIDRPSGVNELVGLQAEIDRWERQVAIDVVTVEEVRADLDPGAKARTAGLLGGESDAAADEATARQQRIDAIRTALASVNGLERQVRYCDPQILELIRRWDGYSATLDKHSDHITALDNEVIRSEAQVAAASAVLDQAKAESVPVLLTAEEETRLEQLCDPAESSSKFGRLLGSSGDENGDDEKQRLLDKVGVSSWTEYSVFRMSPTPPREKLAAVDAAAATLTLAEETLQSARWKQKTDEVAAGLGKEMRQIKDAASPFLDPVASTSIGEGLRAHIEIRDNPQWTRAVDQLRVALGRHGLKPAFGYDPEEIVGWTESWLMAQSSLETSDDQASEPDRRTPEQIEQELADARQDLVRHRRALARIEAVERAAVRSAARLAELKRRYQERSEAPEVSTAAEVMSMILPVAEQAVREFGSSVPVVIVGEMPDLDRREIQMLMPGLEGLAHQVQVVLISGRSEVAEWVGEAGLERAGITSGIKALI